LTLNQSTERLILKPPASVLREGINATLIGQAANQFIIINIQGQITNCPHNNARLAGENEFWRAASHIASALLLIGSSDPEAFLKLDMIY